MNAKETLKKLADVLNIASSDTETVVETVEETKAPEIVETANEPVDEPKEEPKAEAEVIQETPKEEASTKEIKQDDSRVAELENQLKDLKEILKNAFAQPEVQADPEPTVKIPETEPKGLTHSPEAAVGKSETKIGQKGGDIMSRVYKYINNN